MWPHAWWWSQTQAKWLYIQYSSFWRKWPIKRKFIVDPAKMACKKNINIELLQKDLCLQKPHTHKHTHTHTFYDEQHSWSVFRKASLPPRLLAWTRKPRWKDIPDCPTCRTFQVFACPKWTDLLGRTKSDGFRKDQWTTIQSTHLRGNSSYSMCLLRNKGCKKSLLKCKDRPTERSATAACLH